MADVTGFIGNETVELNNAATEATLKALLQATINGNQRLFGALTGISQTSGSQATVNPATVAQINAQNTAHIGIMQRLGTAYGNLSNATDTLTNAFLKTKGILEEFTSGTGNVSGAISKFGALIPGAFGTLIQGIGGLVGYQEKLLQSYQSLTSAGVNFGGSLTQMRMAASNTYMTMDEFNAVVKSNSSTLAKMGGTTNDGAMAFVKLSKNLLSSSIGDDLRSLGYTTKDVNQGMLDYIALTGGRSQKELQNVNAISKGAAEYLEQLDGLSRLTGESREALAAKMKEDAANQAWESYLLTLDEKGREKANAARLEAEARGGKGAAQALQAKLMGLPPMTEAAQRFVGTMKNGNQQIDNLASSVKDSTKGLDDVKRSGSALSVGLAEDSRALGKTSDAIIMSGKGSEELAKAKRAENDQTRNNVRTVAEQIEFEKKAAAEAKKQKESEATDAVKLQKATQELGQAILAQLLPVVKDLWAVLNPFIITGLKWVTEFLKTPGAIQKVIQALGLLAGAFILYKGVMFAGTVARGVAGVAGGVSRMFGGGGPTPPTAPPRPSTAPPSPAGGGGGIGSVLSGLGKGIGDIGKGIGAGLGGLISGTLKGIADGLSALGNPKVLFGSVVLGALAVSVMIAGKAFQQFTNIDWKNVAIGTVTIGLLAAGAAALSSIAPLILIGSAAIAALGLAIGIFAGGLKAFPSGVLEGMTAPLTEIGKSIGGVIDQIGGFLGGLLDNITDIFKTVWDVIKWPFEQIGKMASDAFNFVKETASKLWGSITEIFKNIWTTISSPFSKVSETASTAFTSITDTVSKLWTSITGIFDGIWNTITAPFKKLPGEATTSFSGITSFLGTWFEYIKSTFDLVWNVISFPFKTIFGLVTGNFDLIKDTVSGLFTSIKTVFEKITSVMSGPFEIVKKIATGFGTFVTDIVSGLFDKVTNLLGFVKTAASAVLSLFATKKEEEKKKEETPQKKKEEEALGNNFPKAVLVLMESANTLLQVSRLFKEGIIELSNLTKRAGGAGAAVLPPMTPGAMAAVGGFGRPGGGRPVGGALGGGMAAGGGGAPGAGGAPGGGGAAGGGMAAGGGGAPGGGISRPSGGGDTGAGAEKTGAGAPSIAVPTKTAAKGGSMSDQDAKAMTMRHEGIRYEPYKDSLGLWTVGVGHLIGDGRSLPGEWNRKFSHEEVMKLYDEDYEHHKKQAQQNVPGFSKFDSLGQAALIDLTFNMGPGWPRKFPNTSKKLASGDSEGAASGLMDSLWYRQVKSRGPTIVDMIKNSKATARDGGKFEGPESGYPVILHGKETVVPENVSKEPLTAGMGDVESLKGELQMLNNLTKEMLFFMKETADYSKRNVDATKSLSGDLFK